MKIWVEQKPYRRRFRQPLRTAHGLWRWRQGILLRCQDDAGRVGFGEAAPLPWFGTETLDQAQQFWRQKAGWLRTEAALLVPDGLPASQFAVGAALSEMTAAPGPAGSVYPLGHEDICGLLPAGGNALETWSGLWTRGHRTFKWKVGVFPVAAELAWLESLIGQLPADCRLRLDANGGLTLQEAEAWLARCDALGIAAGDSIQGSASGGIEYLEQPLPPGQFEAMQRLSHQFETAIALDESVSTRVGRETCDRQNWPGLYVIKPSIGGYPARLKAFLSRVGPRVTFSSAFETVVGRQAVLGLALEHYRQYLPQRPFPALGLGTANYFDDDWDHLTPEALWQTL
jgi:O-succinylbenzoate synthase